MASSSKFTPEIRAKLIQGARMNLHPKVACQLAGINISSYRNWLMKGERAAALEPEELDESDYDYLAFYEAINEAEAAGELVMIGVWREGAKTDWKAAKEFLARRHPERWGQRVEINVNRVDEEILELLEAEFDEVEEEVKGTANPSNDEGDIVDAELVELMPPAPKELETGNDDNEDEGNAAGNESG